MPHQFGNLCYHMEQICDMGGGGKCRGGGGELSEGGGWCNIETIFVFAKFSTIVEIFINISTTFQY